MALARRSRFEFENDLQDKPIPFIKHSISTNNVDYTVQVLVSLINDGDIFIPPFQRNLVWSHKQASHFIESLLLGLPVPGIFLSKEQATGKLLVIDGQQRLTTLKSFFPPALSKNIDNNFSELTTSKQNKEAGDGIALIDVQEEFVGKTYKTLTDLDRRNLNNSSIHATILNPKAASSSADDAIYYVFNRLNTGASQLRPQDIRAAIYHGPFNELLNTLNKNEFWRNIFGSDEPDIYKRDQELILRFFALYFRVDDYKTPMEGFLNAYMAYNRNLQYQSAEQLTKLFAETIEFAYYALGDSAFRPIRALNAAIFDAVMVGLGRRLEETQSLDIDQVYEAYNNLVSNEEFDEDTRVSTAGIKKVKHRIRLATEAFASIKTLNEK